MKERESEDEQCVNPLSFESWFLTSFVWFVLAGRPWIIPFLNNVSLLILDSVSHHSLSTTKPTNYRTFETFLYTRRNGIYLSHLHKRPCNKDVVKLSQLACIYVRYKKTFKPLTCKFCTFTPSFFFLFLTLNGSTNLECGYCQLPYWYIRVLCGFCCFMQYLSVVSCFRIHSNSELYYLLL